MKEAVSIIEWVDIHHCDDWFDEPDLHPAPLATVGVIVKETDEAIWVSPTWSMEDEPVQDRYGSVWCIPKGVVRSVKSLILKED